MSKDDNKVVHADDGFTTFKVQPQKDSGAITHKKLVDNEVTTDPVVEIKGDKCIHASGFSTPAPKEKASGSVDDGSQSGGQADGQAKAEPVGKGGKASSGK